MAYPLPDSPAFESALRYYLVAVPDRPEYRRAALGAYTEFTKYWLWGLEKTSDESHEAAASWELAVAKTLELLEMDWPNQVIDHIDELEILLRRIAQNDIGDPPCCGNLDPEDELIGPPPIDPGVGTPPASYGDWPVADWAEYYDHLCGNAHSYALLLVLNTRKLATLVAAGTAAITLVASILGILSGAGILLKIAYTTAAALVGGLVNVSGTTILNDAADDLEANYDEIICAIMHNYPPLSGVIEAIVSPLAWSTFFQWINWENATNVLLRGGTGSTSLPNRPLVGECEQCAPPQLLHWEFTADAEGWQRTTGAGAVDTVSCWVPDDGVPEGCITTRSGYGRLKSPSFEFVVPVEVRLSRYRRRVAGGGNIVRRRIIRASDDAVVYDVSNNVGGGTTWVAEGPGNWVTIAPGIYYIRLNSDSVHRWDNVSLEVREV